MEKTAEAVIFVPAFLIYVAMALNLIPIYDGVNGRVRKPNGVEVFKNFRLQVFKLLTLTKGRNGNLCKFKGKTKLSKASSILKLTSGFASTRYSDLLASSSSSSVFAVAPVKR